MYDMREFEDLRDDGDDMITIRVETWPFELLTVQSTDY